MKYVAFLRGINVGGKAKVEMPRLKQAFEKAGAADVLTYINSGNVIFEDPRECAELVLVLEKAIEKEFGFATRIVLRTKESIDRLCKEIPSDWKNDAEQRTDVMFLWPEQDRPEVIQLFKIKPEIETLRYIAGAVVWNISRDNVRRGSIAKIIGTDLYKHMTIRNINTVRKLRALMAVK
jgi:uncharacterized protein (DUF1697 family)